MMLGSIILVGNSCICFSALTPQKSETALQTFSLCYIYGDRSNTGKIRKLIFKKDQKKPPKLNQNNNNNNNTVDNESKQLSNKRGKNKENDY